MSGPNTSHAASQRADHLGASHGATRAGVLFGVTAYGLWGVFPIYFKAVQRVSAIEVLTHRIIWSALFLLILIFARRSLVSLLAALRDGRTIRRLSLTTLLIGGNWLVFIYAVGHGQTLQASLGYFINPLVNILLGFVVLHERLRRWQWVSVALATTGVCYLTIALRQPPIMSLFLAATFGLYGLLRKTASVDALHGLTVETLLLAPPALVYLAVQTVRGGATFGGPDTSLNLLLALAGVITATPLLLFTAAARRLPMATLGFLQYLAPTGHFLCATIAFGEPFTAHQLIAFGLIWTALIVYSIDTARCTVRRG